VTTPLPPGWYPDPDGKPEKLYWDGHQWYSAQPSPEEPTPPTPPLAEESPSAALLEWRGEAVTEHIPPPKKPAPPPPAVFHEQKPLSLGGQQVDDVISRYNQSPPSPGERAPGERVPVVERKNIWLGALAVFAIVVTIVVLSSGDDDGPGTATTATTTTPTTRTSPAAPYREFDRDGTYEICTGMLCDFPAGTYETSGPREGLPACNWLVRTALAVGSEYFVSNGWTVPGEKAQVVLRDGQFFTSNRCATWRYLG